MDKLDCGMVGLSVMGRGLALNLCDHGYSVGGYNRSRSVTDEMLSRWPHKNFTPFNDIHTLVAALRRPRRIFLMVKAGSAVDQVFEQLLPLLDPGDMVLDCGNSHFTDTERRFAQAAAHGIHFFGIGVSGGEKGARHGPAIMAGGDRVVYDKSLRGMLEAISAKAPDGSSCCGYMGTGGAGHFVKMVHNGIEYADMQLISEAYLLLRSVGGLENLALAELFASWNKGELQSYLIEITADILREPDDLATGALLDHIKDSAAQKGTGRWAVTEALRLGVNISMITAATDARILSADFILRENTAKLLSEPTLEITADTSGFADLIRRSLYVAKILAYAQGFALLQKACAEYGWIEDMGKIAGVFRGGCIIRAAFLEEIVGAYQESPALLHLTNAPFFTHKLAENHLSLRHMVSCAIQNGLPVPAFVSAISYWDALCGAPLGANLLQAQRDYFGAHTYQRTDREGVFHHEWGQLDG